jgi:hypothetical protein
MNIVQIPFKAAFKEVLLSDQKVCTARTKRMGAAGDRFQAFGSWFALRSVEDVALWEVALLWKEEGCTSQEHFIEIWKSIHPKTGYSEAQRVYLHRFQRVKECVK